MSGVTSYSGLWGALPTGKVRLWLWHGTAEPLAYMCQVCRSWREVAATNLALLRPLKPKLHVLPDLLPALTSLDLSGAPILLCAAALPRHEQQRQAQQNRHSAKLVVWHDSGVAHCTRSAAIDSASQFPTNTTSLQGAAVCVTGTWRRCLGLACSCSGCWWATLTAPSASAPASPMRCARPWLLPRQALVMPPRCGQRQCCWWRPTCS